MLRLGSKGRYFRAFASLELLLAVPVPPLVSELNKILVIRFARLGDVILLVPALRALRKHLPAARLDVLVDDRYAAVMNMCSAVSEVLSVNRLAMRDGNRIKATGEILRLAGILRKKRYDLVLDFHSFRETQLLTWYSRARWRLGLKRVHSAYLSFCFNLAPVVESDSLHVSAVFGSMLEPLGIATDSRDYRLEVPSDRLDWSDQFLRSHRISGGEFFVGLNVGAGSHSRTWPQDKFAQLARIILQQPEAKIILFSGPQEDAISRPLYARLGSDRVILANGLPLPELAALFSQCRILISNDTGPMHLAVAAGVPTLGLFSVARPEHYRPLGQHSRFLRAEPIDAISVDSVYSEFRLMRESLQSPAARSFAENTPR
jgi:heptosyltransferase I